MVKRLRRNMDIMDTMDAMDDNTCSLAAHTVHSSLREQQLSTSDRLRGESTSLLPKTSAQPPRHSPSRLGWLLLRARTLASVFLDRRRHRRAIIVH
ncbi:MAG: hypothetical protein ACOX9E_07825 [Lentisphaeria bacterium]